MTLAASLIAAAFPALLIERWTAKDGWPVFRVFVALPDHRIPLGQNFEHFAQAHAAAVDYAASQLPAIVPIIDMTKERG